MADTNSYVTLETFKSRVSYLQRELNELFGRVDRLESGADAPAREADEKVDADRASSEELDAVIRRMDFNREWTKSVIAGLGPETCEKVKEPTYEWKEGYAPPPRASWGDSDARVVRRNHFLLTDLPATADPMGWCISVVEGGIVATHPEHRDPFMFDPLATTVALFSPLVTSERDARLVDRSRR